MLYFIAWLCVVRCVNNVYNMNGAVILSIQSRAKGEGLYIQYNTDTNVVNNLWNENIETFVFLKNGEDSNDLRKSILVNYWLNLKFFYFFSSWIINEFYIVLSSAELYCVCLCFIMLLCHIRS